MSDPSFLSLIIDLCILAVIIAMAAGGWKNGILSTFLRFFSGLIAIFIAYKLYGKLSDYLCSAGLQAKLASHLNLNVLLGIDENTSLPEAAGQTDSSVLIEQLKLPQVIKDALEKHNNRETYALMGVSSFLEYLAMYLAKIILNGLSFLAIYLVSVLILHVIARHLTGLNKVPLLGFFNRLLGLLCGLGLSYLVVVIVLLILVTISPGIPALYTFQEALDKSVIGSWFMSHNPLLGWSTSLPLQG